MECANSGSATQVMLSMPFRDTVSQNPIDITEVNSTHGHPRVMPTMRIKPVQEKWPYPPWQTESLVQKLRAPVQRRRCQPPHCCRAPRGDCQPVARAPLPARDLPRGGRQLDVAVALHGGMLCNLPRSCTCAAPHQSSQSTAVQDRGGSRRNVELCAEEG